MRRQFFKDGIIYGISSLISGVGNILLVPIYTHVLAPQSFGVVDFFLVIQTLIQICGGMEITQGIARFYASASNERTKQSYASTGLIFLTLSVGFLCSILLIGVYLLDIPLFGLSTHQNIAGLAICSIYIRILFYALQGQLRWELRARVYSIANICAVITSVAATTFLLWFKEIGIAGVFYGSLIGYGFGCFICCLALRKTYTISYNLKHLQEMLCFSFPLVFSSLALYAGSYGDRLLLKSQLGFYDLGIYGVGARFASLVTIAIAGFQLGAAPLIYRHFNEPSAPSSLAQLLRIFLVAGTSLVSFLACFSINFLSWLAAPEYLGAWRLVPILSFALLLNSLYIFVPGLTISNLTVRFSLINIFSGFMTLSFVALLLFKYGLIGASLGTLVGSFLAFTFHAAASQSVFPIPIKWCRLYGCLLVVSLVILFCQMFSSLSLLSLLVRSVLWILSLFLTTFFALLPSDRSLVIRSLSPLLSRIH